MKYVGVAYLPIPESRDPVDPALHIKNYAMAIDGKEGTITRLTYPPTLPPAGSVAAGSIVRVAYRDTTPAATNETYYWDLQYAPNFNATYPYRVIGEATPMVWANSASITLDTNPSVYLKVPTLVGMTFPFKGWWDIEAETEFQITTQFGSVIAGIAGPLFNTSPAANVYGQVLNPLNTAGGQTSKVRRGIRRLVTSTTIPLDFYQMGFSSKIGRSWRIRATPLEVGP